jgi:prepilin peptidase CpaA
MANTFVLSFFPLLMVIAGIGDFFTLRIPNWLNALIAGAAPVMALVLGMPLDIMGLHGAAGFVMLLAGMTLFFAGQIGGGDAKLMAAAGLWIGLDPLLHFAIDTALAGGVLAVIMYGTNRLITAGEFYYPSWLGHFAGKKVQLPYGIAIAAGALLVFPDTWWLSGTGH